MMRTPIVCAALALLTATASAQRGDTTKPPPAPAGQPQSLFTTAQAARGEKVYENVCVECHEKLEYTGAEFRSKWNNRSAFELWDLLRSTMPDEKPGTLSAQEYSDVVAYMMRLNGVPPGKVELPKDEVALKKIRIVIPK